MDRRHKLVALAFALFSGGASAGYALPSPPAGFGGSPGSWSFTPASNAPTVGGGSPSSNAPTFRGPGPSLPTPSGAIPTAAAYRLAPTAARVLAKGVILGGVAGAAIAGAAWLLENCFARQSDGTWKRVCGPDASPTVSDGYRYYVSDSSPNGPLSNSPAEACTAWAGSAGASSASVSWVFKSLGPNYPSPNGPPTCVMARYNKTVNGQCTGPVGFQCSDFSRTMTRQANPACPVGWFYTSAGCVQTAPPTTVSPQQVEDEMATKPLPQVLPPGIPYPVELPIWNPTITDPAIAQPLRVPNGNPRAIPDTSPQRYTQPVTDWTHSPTISEPWRMDVAPKDITSESPTGVAEPTPVTSGAPQGVPKEEVPDLCATNPDIAACAKLGSLEADPVRNTDVPLAIAPASGFPSGGVCPQPKQHTLMGRSFSFSVQPICDFATMIKPLLIGFAWLAAAMTFLGVARREN